MDWVVLAFLGILAIAVTLIVMTLVSLPKLGDERKNFIKLKAQSYAFTIVIGFALIEIGRNIYRTVWGDSTYEGINPFTFLLAISVVYLVSLLFTKRKYGG